MLLVGGKSDLEKKVEDVYGGPNDKNLKIINSNSWNISKNSEDFEIL